MHLTYLFPFFPASYFFLLIGSSAFGWVSFCSLSISRKVGHDKDVFGPFGTSWPGEANEPGNRWAGSSDMQQHFLFSTCRFTFQRIDENLFERKEYSRKSYETNLEPSKFSRQLSTTTPGEFEKRNQGTVLGFFTTSVGSLLWGSWTPKSSIPTVSQSRLNWLLIGSLFPGIMKCYGLRKLTVVQGKYKLKQSNVLGLHKLSLISNFFPLARSSPWLMQNQYFP